MKIAIIGAWHVHTRDYATTIQKNPKAELCCLWDDNQERGKAAAEQFGIPFQPDLNAIWNDPSIDSIQVTTATTHHKDIFLAAAKAGKNIFTEKVLATTNEDAEEIAKAIKASGVKFTISYPQKTAPAIKAAKALVESGKLGQITYARMHNSHDGSSSGWLPPHFYDAAETGGGAMMDLGAHPMYLLNWFMGEPKSVVSMFTTVTDKPVEDNAVSVIEFANGAIGVSETGFVSRGVNSILEMNGTKGGLIICNGVLQYTCEETEGKLVELKDLPEADPLPLNAWIDAVVDGTAAPNGVDDAVALTKFMVGAYESCKTGKKYIF